MGAVWFLALWLLAAASVAEGTEEKRTTKKNGSPNYDLSDVKKTVNLSGEKLVLSNPNEIKNLDEILAETIAETDTTGKKTDNDAVSWKTLSDAEKKSLNRLLKNVASSTISESAKQPKSNLISTLRLLVKNMVLLESRLTNQTKQTTFVMKSVVELKAKCSQALSGLKSAKEDVAKLKHSLDVCSANTTQMLASLQSQYKNIHEFQNTENEIMKKEIKALGMKGNPVRFAKEMEQVKSDIDQRLGGLIQQGKGRESQCSVLDQQAVMLYGMWQKLYKNPDAGSVKVVQATSSSVGWRGVASRAVDGNNNPRYGAGGCTHTNAQLRPWLLLKLQGISNITGVELTNRGDCCHRRLSNFSIEVFMTDPTTSPGMKGQECYHYNRTVGKAATVLIKCKSPVQALYVKITIVQRAKAILTVCEAVVKGHLLGLIGGKPSLQSSVTSAQTSSEKANDGDMVTCSQTMVDSADSAPWWQTDMREAVTVHTVYIRNRNDERYIWLRNITITVHKQFPSACAEVTPHLCATFPGTVGKGQMVALTCKRPITGRYLKIIRGVHKDGGALSLCEVAVNDKKMIFG